jgi:hypothetical protein
VDGADVFYFSRIPRARDAESEDGVIHGPETWQYVKTFTKPEIMSLIESSRFELPRASISYVVRDSDDLDRIGSYVDETGITADESYRLPVSLVK